MLDSLPSDIREAAAASFSMFQRDPDHPSLRRHKLHNMARGPDQLDSWSISVTRRYRAIYFFDPINKANIWYWIGSHADYDHLAGRS